MTIGEMARLYAALKVSRVSGWLVDRLLGQRRLPEPERIRVMEDALGEITTLVPFEHPACGVALRALASGEPVAKRATIDP